MFIAKKLRKENIVEYLLYMWQIEDLIRAYGLDLDKIDEKIIQPYPVSIEEKKTLREWYESLIDMMRAENVQITGHLQLNKNTLAQLEEFHQLVLSSGKIAEYNSLFYKIGPLIQQLTNKQSSEVSDVETCFNFQYAFMLLKLKKREISHGTLDAQKQIGKFLVSLSKYFKQYQEGELDLEED